MSFGEFVKSARNQLGMTQDQLARQLNISFSTINRWENGKTYPNKLTREFFYEYCKKNGIKIFVDIDR